MKNKVFAFFQIALLSLFFSAVVFGSSAGTADDPLATKSYVDKCINDAVSQISSSKLSDEDKSEIIEEVASKISINTNSDYYVEAESSASDTYKAVELKQGQVILGDEGTEIILRSGIAFAYITGSDTMLDVSTGTSLIDKNSISKNHLIIVPRNDGRGIRATENSWLLVKGGYEIQDYTG